MAISEKNFIVKNGLDVNGNVTANSLISNVVTGIAPLQVQSTTLVANLYVARALHADGVAIAFDVNGTTLSSQSEINFLSGNNITVTDVGNGNVIFNAVSGIALQHNGIVNSSQSKLNLNSGNGITLVDQGNGNIQINTSVLHILANNIAASSQSSLNLMSGNNIQVADNGNGNISFSTSAIKVNFYKDSNIVSSQTILNFASSPSISITDLGFGTLQFSAINSTVPNFADDIIPTGNIDGNTAIYTLPQVPNPASSLNLFLNGQRQDTRFSFTLANANIIYNSANIPQIGASHICNYRY